MVYTLEQTERERRIMLAGISHDLRTPLTRIRLTAEMLPDEFLREGLVYDVDDMDAILNRFISYMRDGSDEE
ncbi:histidine kinase dimerization/phospho-acceptor domain-containing protein, partial [Acinetobacter baumannii]